MAAKLIGSLLVSLGLDSTQFVTGTKKAQAQMTSFQRSMNNVKESAAGLAKGLAVGFVVGGITAIASDAFRMASGLQEAAAATGATIEQLQRLRLAAAQNGSTADQLDASLSRLSVKLGEAQSGSKQAAAAFATLGISVADLKGLNAGDAFALIAEKMAMIKDPTLQAAAAKAIFGKSAAQLLPLLKAGTAALDEATEASKRNGEISTQDAAKLDELADSWDLFKSRLGVATANVIADVASFVTAWRDGAAKIDSYVDAFDAAIAGAARSAIASMQRLYTGVKTWISDKLGAVWKSATDKIAVVKMAFFNLYDAVVGNSYIPDMVDGIRDHMARLDAVMVKPATDATNKTAAAFRELQEKAQAILDRLFPEIREALDYKTDKNTLVEYFDKAKMSAEQLAVAMQALRDQQFGGLQALTGGADSDLDQQAADDVANVVDSIGTRLDSITPKIGALGASIRQSFGTLGEYANRAFDVIAGNLQDAILGAQSFGDAIRGVVKQLASMALSAAFGALKTSLGIPGFAKGTNFAPGGLAMVGERGPELVNLPRGSQVIPNHELGGMGGQVHKPTFVFPGITNAEMAREAAGQAARRYRRVLNGPIRGAMG